MKEHDGVLLKDGREGTIVAVFENGEAFMVEIADEQGREIDMPVVKPDDIEKVTYVA